MQMLVATLAALVTATGLTPVAAAEAPAGSVSAPADMLLYAGAPMNSGPGTTYFTSSAQAADARAVVGLPSVAGAVPDYAGTSWAWTTSTGSTSTLVVRGPQGERTVAELPSAWPAVVQDWTADGARIAVTVFAGDRSVTPHIAIIDVTSGSVSQVPVAEALFTASFVPGTTRILAQGNHFSLLDVDTATGAVSPVAFGEPTQHAVHPVAARDGRSALVRVVTDIPLRGGTTTVDSLRVVALDGSGVRTLPTSADIGSPQWSPDGAWAYFSSRTTPRAPAELFRVRTDGTATPERLTATAYLDERLLGVTPGTAPDPVRAVGLTAELTSSHVTLSWQGNQGAVSYLVTRGDGTTPPATGSGTPTTRTRFSNPMPAPGVYTYAVSAVDAAGVVHAPVTITVSLTGPDVVSAPRLVVPRVYDTSWPVLVQRDMADFAGVVEWTERTGGTQDETAAWSPWLWGTATKQFRMQRGAPTALLEGHSYFARVRALDAYGNASVPVIASTVVAEDEHTAVLRGRWASAKGSSFVLGSLSRSASAGASATLTIRYPRAVVRTLTVLGEKGPRTGRFAVYLDGRRVAASVDTRRSRRAEQQVLWSGKGWAARGTHTLRIVVLPTKGRTTVGLDGFAVANPL